MDTRTKTREYRLSQWLAIIKECRNSGMNVRSWCVQNNVNEKQFYYWQRKLRELASEKIAPVEKTATFAQLSVPVSKPDCSYTSPFIPSMVIRVGNASIELAEHVQPELLASVLKVFSDA